MARSLSAVLAAALLAAACSGSEGGGHDGLLATVDDTGEVVVVTPEGEPVAMVTDLGETATAFQPVWLGPDHLVLVERGSVAGDLVVTSIDGVEQRRVGFLTAPFYVYPEPGGSPGADIVSLRNHPSGSLSAELVHEDGSVDPLEGTFSYYFTWMPDGEVVAHSGGSVLLSVYPELRQVAATPGLFGAPAAFGDSVVYVRTAGSTSYLSVLTDEDSRDLATISGPSHLVVGGDRVAVRSVAGEAPAGGIQVVAQQLPAIPSDALVVVGLEDGAVEMVAPQGIVAFFWDPAAQRLLYLDVTDRQDVEFSWHVWEDGVTTDYPPFVPERSWFFNFTPFFDQYAQSMTLWSPNGNAFAFPGTIGDETGVWVQHLDRDAPVLVAPGSWAAWGPPG